MSHQIDDPEYPEQWCYIEGSPGCTAFESAPIGDDVDLIREADARYWLSRGYITVAKIQELRDMITAKRGAAGAEALIQEMRKQWKIQHKDN